jgi:hypothetical protein
MGEQSLWAEIALKLTGPRAAATGMGEPSLQSAGALGSACQVWASRNFMSCCSHGRTSLGQQEPWVCLLVQLPETKAASTGIGHQDFRQKEFCVLLARHGLTEGSTVALQTQESKPLVSRSPGACLPHGLLRPSLLACTFCYP